MAVEIQQTNDEMNSNALDIYNKACISFTKNSFKSALEGFIEANRIFTSIHNTEYISVTLSWISYLNYQLNSNNYYKIVIMLNDAKYLADATESVYALFVYYFAYGNINYLDGNYTEAMYNLDKAKNLATQDNILNSRIFILLAELYERSGQLEKAYYYWNIALKSTNLSKNETSLVEANLKSLKKYSNDLTQKETEPILNTNIDATPDKDPLIALLKIARTVSAQTNIDVLLKTIAEITKNALDADRCTVFLLDKEKKELWSKVALGLESQEIRIPADSGLAGHVVTTGETIIINDAYNDNRFNKNIDMQTGYKTKTLLCMPIRNIKHELVGVFQVLNKNNDYFTEHDEDLLVAIGSSAGIALENARLFQHQQQILEQQKILFSSFIDTLAASIDARDKITSGHSNRVRIYSKLICQKLGMENKFIETIEHAAILHDIGKIGIRDSVLQKEGKLTIDEYDHIKQHVNITHDILSKIYLSNDAKDVAEIASSHHEKYDGSGYFRGLKGQDIPIGGRILAVSDVFDAITSKRHYRDKMSIENAIQILLDGAGTHFDNDIIETFLDISLNQIVKVFMTEFNTQLESDDEILLQDYTLKQLYNIIIDAKNSNYLLLEEEKTNKLIKIFNKYYTNKTS